MSESKEAESGRSEYKQDASSITPKMGNVSLSSGGDRGKDDLCVLILDENPFDREVLMSMCNLVSYRTQVASDMEKADEIMDSCADVQLALFDYATVMRAKKEAFGKYVAKLVKQNIEVVIISANESDRNAVRQDVPSSIPYRFWVKPLTSDDIRSLKQDSRKSTPVTNSTELQSSDDEDDEVWEVGDKDFTNFTLLVLDDTQFELECVVEMCKARDFRVFGATTPEKADELLEKESINMVLMDYHQPRGFNPVAYLRKLQKMNKAVVVMSADSNLQLISECLRDNLAADFLIKPLSNSDLTRVLQYRNHNQKSLTPQPDKVAKERVPISKKDAETSYVNTEGATASEFQILVLDDSPFDVEVIAKMCQQANYKTITANCQDEADDILKHNKNKVSLVLCDYYMPGFDTLAYLNTLKKQGIACVVMSGDSDKRLIERCMSNNLAADFLVKPLKPTSILNMRKYASGWQPPAATSIPRNLLLRCNSTSSIYVQSTIHVPDLDRILLAMALVLHQMVRGPPETQTQGKDAFNATENRTEFSAITVFKYLKDVVAIAQWSPECNIIGLVLMSRLVTRANEVVFHEGNWDMLVLCAMLIAQKIWDDTAIANVDIPIVWERVYPSRHPVSLTVVNRMEEAFLSKLSFDVYVSPATYTECYFALRELVGDQMMSDRSKQVCLNDVTAARLGARSAAWKTKLLTDDERKKAKKKRAQPWTPPLAARRVTGSRTVLS